MHDAILKQKKLILCCKMDLQQRLNEARKEQSECQKVVEHYGALHENLYLEEVE